MTNQKMRDEEARIAKHHCYWITLRLEHELDGNDFSYKRAKRIARRALRQALKHFGGE